MSPLSRQFRTFAMKSTFERVKMLLNESEFLCFKLLIIEGRRTYFNSLGDRPFFMSKYSSPLSPTPSHQHRVDTLKVL